jgi:hypothetical protein
MDRFRSGSWVCSWVCRVSCVQRLVSCVVKEMFARSYSRKENNPRILFSCVTRLLYYVQESSEQPQFSVLTCTMLEFLKCLLSNSSNFFQAIRNSEYPEENNSKKIVLATHLRSLPEIFLSIVNKVLLRILGIVEESRAHH